MTKSIELSEADGNSEQATAGSANGGTTDSAMTGMQAQLGFGFPNQNGFNNGMAWNGMAMSGMPNMMANSSWNGMNSMGKSSSHLVAWINLLTYSQTSIT